LEDNNCKNQGATSKTVYFGGSGFAVAFPICSWNQQLK